MIGSDMISKVIHEEPKLQAILSLSPSGFLFLDESHRILNASNSAIKFFQKSKADLLNSTYTNLLKGKQAPTRNSIVKFMESEDDEDFFATIDRGVYVQIKRLKAEKYAKTRWIVIYDFLDRLLVYWNFWKILPLLCLVIFIGKISMDII
jgi:PAS domain-containing protein